VTNREWASLAPWAEVVARSLGRAKYNSIRKLRAKLRHMAIVRRLRHVGDIHQRGLQRQLAEELGVVRSVICEDMKQIKAAGGQGEDANTKQWGNEVGRRLHEPKEEAMSQGCTVRLPDALYGYLQIEADARQCGVSDVIREGLEHLLGLTSILGAKSTIAPEPAPLSTAHDGTERLLAGLPMDVRESIEERARLLDLPVSKVVTSMLIVQQPPNPPGPQVSGTACPEREFITWQEFKRRREQDSKAASDAALSSAVPIPEAASLNGSGQDVNSRPSGSWNPTVGESTLPTQRR
jgi:hypothetical protein